MTPLWKFISICGGFLLITTILGLYFPQQEPIVRWWLLTDAQRTEHACRNLYITAHGSSDLYSAATLSKLTQQDWNNISYCLGEGLYHR
jgi:hypothetical protein